MSNKKTEYQKIIEPRVNKILSDIEKLVKISLAKEYTLDDVKQIENAIKKSSNKMLKTLSNNLEEAESFSFESESLSYEKEKEKEINNNISTSNN